MLVLDKESQIQYYIQYLVYTHILILRININQEVFPVYGFSIYILMLILFE